MAIERLRENVNREEKTDRQIIMLPSDALALERSEEKKFSNLQKLYDDLKIPLMLNNIGKLWEIGDKSAVTRTGTFDSSGSGEIALNQSLNFKYEDIVNTNERREERNIYKDTVITLASEEEKDKVIISPSGKIIYRKGLNDTYFNVRIFYQNEQDQYGVKITDSVFIPMETQNSEGNTYFYYQSGPYVRELIKYFSPDKRFIEDAAHIINKKAYGFARDRMLRGLLPCQLRETAVDRILRAST